MQNPSLRLPGRFLSLVVLFALLALSTLQTALQARTLTAKDGRTIEVEILAYDGDTIRIKRLDSGQTFTVPIDTFSPADQRTLRAEAEAEAAKPKPVPAGSITVELSRGVFATEKRESTGLTYTHDQWGYNVVITNRSGPMLESLRAEYVLLLEPNPYHTAVSERNKLKRTRGNATLDPIATGARTQFRTSTVEAIKVSLKPGWVWGDEDRKRTTRDKLYGVWVRIYRGDELIAEAATPAGIVTRETW